MTAVGEEEATCARRSARVDTVADGGGGGAGEGVACASARRGGPAGCRCWRGRWGTGFAGRATVRATDARTHATRAAAKNTDGSRRARRTRRRAREANPMVARGSLWRVGRSTKRLQRSVDKRELLISTCA